MDIKQMNRTLAEFINAQFGMSCISDYKNQKTLDKYIQAKINYHSNWSKLMPVVEKIESIKNSDDYEVDIFGNCCDIGGKFEAVGKTKIEATHKAVYDFIIWYNQNKKKNQ